MYTQQEAARIRQKFWTVFGQYMRPVPGVDGEAVNWLNYKTGIRQLFFRMDADNKSAVISVEFRQREVETRMQYYNRFLEMKTFFENELPGWTWHESVTDEHGQVHSAIISRLEKVNIFDEGSWPAIIAFFKKNIMGLDRFWGAFRDMIDY